MRFDYRAPQASARRWRLPVVAAVLGWLLLCLLLAMGVRPLGWLLGAVAVTTVAVPALLAHGSGRASNELGAFTFAALMLCWPPLAALTLAVLSLTGTVHWQ